MISQYLIIILSLIVTTPGAMNRSPKVALVNSRHLSDFPSCSSINYRDGKLYLVGDDAKNLLILDPQYHVLDSVKLFEYSGKRIPKKTKADLEAATFETLGDKTSFILMGSAATPTREVVEIIPFNVSLSSDQMITVSTKEFVDKLKERIPEINIEGLTVTDKNSILANRANLNNKTNHLIISTSEFWKDTNSKPHIAIIKFPMATKDIIGVSEIHYDKKSDRLFLTCSTELTSGAYSDGEIGDSYLGWINRFSGKQDKNEIVVDQLINLTNVHPDFSKQKIEGMCIELHVKSKHTIHLASDDDLGSSKIFKIALEI